MGYFEGFISTQGVDSIMYITIDITGQHLQHKWKHYFLCCALKWWWGGSEYCGYTWMHLDGQAMVMLCYSFREIISL